MRGFRCVGLWCWSSGDVEVIGAVDRLGLAQLQALAAAVQANEDHAVCVVVDALAHLVQQGLQLGHAEPAFVKRLLPTQRVVLHIAQGAAANGIFADVVTNQKQVSCVHVGQCLVFWRKRCIWQACRLPGESVRLLQRHCFFVGVAPPPRYSLANHQISPEGEVSLFTIWRPTRFRHLVATPFSAYTSQLPALNRHLESGPSSLPSEPFVQVRLIGRRKIEMNEFRNILIRLRAGDQSYRTPH